MTLLSSHHRLALEALRAATFAPGFEYRSPLLRLYAQTATPRRGESGPCIHLEAVEKVSGGVVSLSGRLSVTSSELRDFFTDLALEARTGATTRPYRLGQSYDGAMHAPVLTAFKMACDALGLSADELYREAYPRSGDPLPEWETLREESDWQGGVESLTQWGGAALAALRESLTEMNYHSLVSVLAKRCALIF